jgi:hypothetical protein
MLLTAREQHGDRCNSDRPRLYGQLPVSAGLGKPRRRKAPQGKATQGKASQGRPWHHRRGLAVSEPRSDPLTGGPLLK